MDLIQNMLDLLLSPLLVALVTLLLLIAVVTALPVAARKRLRHFKNRHRDQLVGKQVFPVSSFSQEDIAGRRLNPRLAKPGFLVLSPAGEAAFYIPTARDKFLRHDFTAASGQAVYLDNDRYGNILPSMIRLHEQGRSHYLYATGRLGSPDTGKTRWLFEQLGRVLGSKHIPLPQSRALNPPLLGALLVVIGLAGFTVWMSWDDSLDYVPMTLTQTDAGQVLTASRRILYRLGRDGTLKERIELEQLGVKDGISHMQALESGHLLLGDSGAGVIKRCDLGERICEALPGFNGEPLFLRAFQFHYDAQRARIYAADSSRHRLLELSEDGKPIRELANNELLCFPNNPVVVNDNLYLANTNHHEVLVWSLDHGPGKPVGRWLTVEKGRSDVNCPAPLEGSGMAYFARERVRRGGERALPFESGRRGRVWPFSIAPDRTGSWWVINGGNGLQFGDILKFAGEEAEPRPERVILSDEVDPIALLPRTDDLLIADTEAPAIIRAGLDGKELGVFGDPGFLAELSRLSERREQRFLYRMIGVCLTAGFLVLMIGALVLLRHFRIRDIIAQDPAFQTAGT